jgi:hypothetical protein
MRRPRLALAAASAACAVLLAACGGGLYVGVDVGGDGEPPDVSIASAATEVLAGTSFRVVAAASDPDGIEQVWFYRLDGDRWTELADCHEEERPYECDVFVPADGRLTVQVRARAFDGWDDEADSNVLTLPVVD